MIQVPIQATVTTSGTHASPYTCTFSSTDDCVTFDIVTLEDIVADDDGSYIASTTVNFLDTACIDNALISATFTDANGCTQTTTLVVTNICASLTNSIANNGEFSFVATTTGGNPDYTYKWVFDNTLFSSSADLDATDNVLNLTLKSPTQPTSTNINCTVTDNNGCTSTSAYTYFFCKPTINNSRIVLTCSSELLSRCNLNVASSRINYDLNNYISVCAGQELDWSTLETTQFADICIVNNGDGTINVATSRTTQQSVLVNWTVKTTTGIKSEVGIISITIPECTQTRDIVTSPDTYQLNATHSVSDVILLETSKRVGGNYDLSTMAITNTPSFGTATINPNGDIKYTITDITTTPSIPDIVKWSIQSSSGKYAYTTETILRDVIAAPVANNDQICVTCGEATSAINILSNDTGDIDVSTVIITDGDSDISTEVANDGTVIFTATPGASFSNILKYTVNNTQGVASNKGNLIVSAACTGIAQSPLNITCFGSKIFNILDYFTDYNAFGTAFVEDGSTASPDYTTQGGLISGGLGQVNFTTINPGTYRFKFTAQNIVACSGVDDEGYLTIVNGATPALSFGVPVNNGDGTFTIPFTYASLNNTLNFTVTDNGSPASFQSGIIASGGSGSFTIYSSSTNTIIISTTTVCGTNINDTVVLP